MEMGDGGGGMVAVVRGLPDAALAVTLLDGSRKYTLLPTAATAPPAATLQNTVHIHHRPAPCLPPLQLYPRLQSAGTDAPDVKPCLPCDSATQAVDGRYATIYKMAHCHLQPTSPRVELTEFPPQRVEPCRGHGNFVVGRVASGESSLSPIRTTGSFKGAMSWPDRGSVSSPRGSQELDAFAKSLRKYPSGAPERSSEMFERLVNYTHNNNVKSCQSGRSQGSPTRSESSSSGAAFHSTSTTLQGQRLKDSLLSKAKGGSDESPPLAACRPCTETREGALFPRHYDVRHLRELSRRGRRGPQNNAYTYSSCLQISHLPAEMSPEPQTKVNTETQAEIVMVNREVTTSPREKIPTRNAAVPAVSPSSSVCDVTSPHHETPHTCHHTPHTHNNMRSSTHTCSSTHIPTDLYYTRTVRKTHSQGHLTSNHERKVNLLSLIAQEIVKSNKSSKEEISSLLSDVLGTRKHRAICFVNSVVYNLKDIFNKTLQDDNRQETLLVLRNPVQNTGVQTVERGQTYREQSYSEDIVHDNIETDRVRYIGQLVEVITCWMETNKELKMIDNICKRTVAEQLAADVVDRHRYLELNPDSRGSDADELEHLKYQLFKRINKLVGKYHLNTIGHASELMNKLSSLHVPTLTTPAANRNDIDSTCSGTDCCDQTNKEHFRTGTKRLSAPYNKYYFQGHTEREEQPTGNVFMTGYVEQRSQSVVLTCGVPACPASTQSEKSQSSQSLSVHPGASNATEVGNNSKQSAEPPQRRLSTDNNASSRIPKSRSQAVRLPEANTMHPRGKRRVSIPPNLPQGGMELDSASQTPPTGPNLANIEESPATTSLSCPSASCARRPHNDHNASAGTTTVSESPLSDQYDEFVKNWSQQLPIHTTKPEEIALIDKMRLGIYNGIWKAITKLQMNPATLNNEFYYRDLLDDEVEELLNLLPESPELLNNKQHLKSQLVEKTMDTRRQILSAATGTSYKQQLVENVVQNLPRRTVDLAGENRDRLIEDVQKLHLAEDFIMYTKYREQDRVKAKVYKNKLEKHVQELIDELKMNEGKEIKDVNMASYREDIMRALHKVPPPGDDTLREEANEILIGIEIEQWFADLPLYPPRDYVDSLCRRRYMNILAKKLHDLDKQVGLSDCEDQVGQEIRKFMARFPLRPEETDNVDFMVDELVNRLRNRNVDIVAGSAYERQTALPGPNGYDDFSRDMQHCSSFAPDGKKARADDSSYMIVGGERAAATYVHRAPNVHSRRSSSPESQPQWYNETPAALRRVPRERSFERSLGANPPREGRKTLIEQRPENSPQSPRASVGMQTGPWVTIQDRAAEAGPSFRPCGISCAPAKGNLRKGSRSPRTSTQSQANVPAGPPSSSIQTPAFPPASNERTSFGVAESSQTTSSNYPEGSTEPYRSRSSPAQCKKGEACALSEPVRRTSDMSSSMAPVGYSKSREEAGTGGLRPRDSQDSEGEQARCRCMERAWRRRKRRVLCLPCDDYDDDMDYPPYPLRYPCAFYY